MNSYNSGNANNKELLYLYECDDIEIIEWCVKSILKNEQYRKYKEVYKINIDTLKQIINGC